MADVSITVTAIDKASDVLSSISQGILQGFGQAVWGQVTNAIDIATSALFDFMGAASESEQVDAKLAAVLRATGNAAGLNAEQLDDLAGSLSDLTGVDDEAIKSSEALLLTFRNIGGEMFARAQTAVLDMSTLFGGLESSSIQLGKALNDPVLGIGALSRVGIQFTDEQKAMIEGMVALGDVAGAQDVILKEIENQVGGVAEAMGNTWAGSVDKIRVKLGNLQENIGGPFLEAFGPVLDIFGQLIDKHSPELLAFFSGLAEKAANLVPFVELMATRFDLFVKALQSGNVVRILRDITFAMDSFGLPGGLFRDIIAGAQDALKWLQGILLDISPGLSGFANFFSGMLPTLQAWGDTIVNLIGSGLAWLKDNILPFLINAFNDLGLWFQQNAPLIAAFSEVLRTQFVATMQQLGEIVRVTWELISPMLSGIGSLIGGVAEAIMMLATGDTEGAWQALKDGAQAAWDGIVQGFGALADNIAAALGQGSWANVLATWRKNWDLFLEIMSRLSDKVVTIAADVIEGLQIGLQEGWNSIVAWFASAVDGLVQIIKDALHISSPSQVFAGIGANITAGLMQGIQSGMDGVSAVMGNVAYNVTGAAVAGSGMAMSNYGNIVVNLPNERATAQGFLQEMSLAMAV